MRILSASYHRQLATGNKQSSGGERVQGSENPQWVWVRTSSPELRGTGSGLRRPATGTRNPNPHGGMRPQLPTNFQETTLLQCNNAEA